ncbi:protocadherin-16 [Hydra vulgaris]|uniref:Protocadherin-16 n=1 Tax=Hydra vulgaris TaxID=6087 RepID=A0ABM4D1Y6_HYDVU
MKSYFLVTLFFYKIEASYVFYFGENQPPGSKVGQIDGHFPFKQNGAIEYFSINELSGEIISKKNFSMKYYKPQVNEYCFNFTVSSARNKESVEVFIWVFSVPLFSEFSYNIYMKENSKINSLTMLKFLNNTNLKVRYKSENFVDKFQIATNDKNELFLKLLLPLDYETQKCYLINISACVSSFCNFLSVNLNVLDENDNLPEFDKKVYHFEIYENATVSEKVGYVHASDLDSGSNSQIKYSLHGTADFYINETSGDVFLKKSVDAESRIFYKVLCIASDQGNPPKMSSVILSFFILDCNDNPPLIDVIFTLPGIYQIVEGEIIGWKVASVLVSDPDSMNKNLVPDLLINDTNYFELQKEENKFSLFTKKAIDRELTPYLFLLLIAKDSLSALLFTQMKIQINVSDINDNSPKFSQQTYNISVKESIGIGELIVRVFAQDLDFGENGKVSYKIDSSSFLGAEFVKLDQQNGEIIFVQSVNYELFSIIKFQICAFDHGIPQLRSYAFVQINLIDVNDNPPYFSPLIMVFNITENQEVGSFIGQVHADDVDTVDSQKITYYLNSSVIQIDNNTGIITSLKIFDREEKSCYEFEVSTFDSGGLCGKGTLFINIIDLNDCSPKFERSVFNVSITENFPLYKVAFFITAYDLDEGSNALSSYSAIFEDDTFSIDSTTGGVILNHNLKEHPKHLFNFQVSVKDAGGFPGISTARVLLNIFPPSILPPVFTENSYIFNVVENNQIGKVVGVLQAVRPLSQSAAFINFEIADGNNSFSIDSISGSLRANTVLDFEKRKEHFILVKAVDSLNISLINLTKVQINVLDQNDNQPWFVNKTETVSILEGVPIGYIFFKCQAFDNDLGLNGLVKYSITNASGPINVSSESCNVFTTGTIDYELVKEYIVYIEAVDQSSPFHKATLQLKIQVLDTNDNLPIFSNYSYVVHLAENLPLNSLIITVHATDQDSGLNGELIYELVSSKHSEMFFLSINGSLYLKKAIDYEVNQYFLLTLKVIDKGLPPQKNEVKLTIIVEDENDNSPVFEKNSYIFYLNEESPAGSVVGIVTAFDNDQGTNADMEFFILSNDFTHDSENVFGRSDCIIRSLRKFDSESGDKEFGVTITVKDLGKPSLKSIVQVKIVIKNINDHPPKFSKATAYLACVIRETIMNSFVIQIEATDHDVVPYPLKYKLGATENNTSNFLSIFRIDSSSGAVYTKQKIGFEMQSFYETTVSVEEVGDGLLLFNYQKLVIFVVPLLQHTFFTDSCMVAAVSEKSLPLQGIINDAISYNNQFVVSNYSIIEKNVPFLVLKTTGLLQLSQILSFENSKYYQFRISADGLWKKDKMTLLTDFIMMNIYVIPENKYVPTYPDNPERYTISEDWPTLIPFAILQKALDNDADLGGFVVYFINSTNPSNAPVQLSPISRELFLTHSVDYEEQEVLSLKIGITDLAANINERLFNTFTVYISIKDVNDNPPVFKSATSAKIQEGENPGTMVSTIQAEDPDKGETHAAIGYYIMSGNDAGFFSLNYLTGNLSTLKPLNASVRRMYILTIKLVELRENLISSLSSTQNVTIFVDDINDNPPKFSQAVYHAVIKENMMIGSYITQLAYIDSDIFKENTQSVFDLLDNFDKFSIDPKTGIIVSKKSFDREVHSSFILTAVVKNIAYPYGQDFCTVVVDIEDVNDNAPVLSGGEKVKLHVFEKLRSDNTKIHKFEVFDLDIGINAAVNFFLSPVQSYFFINKTTGELHLLNSLDRGERRKYKFSVFVENTSPPYFMSYQNVTIVVVDDDDNKLEFGQKVYYVKVQETTSVNMTILHVYASDKDSGRNSVIYYELVDSIDHFIIDRYSGAISTTVSLDYEQKKEYQLEVKAIDSDSKIFDLCRVIIEVIDMNDNYPVFLQSMYTKVIEKVTSSYVLQVQASDADLNGKQGVSYAFDPPSHHFNISSSTGEIFITDRNLMPGQYHLHVKAVDDGGYKKSYVQVLITIGNSTEIEILNKSVIFTIDENPPNGFVLGTIYAKAKSNDIIIYTILEATNPDLGLAINQEGNIFVNKSESLDYEKYPIIMLGVLASIFVNDETFSSYLTVVINLNDVNDNDPQIIPLNKQYRYLESDSSNFKPHILNYFDVKDDDHIDLNKLKVVIISGNDDGMFEIVEGTTVMTLLKPIDYETKKEHNLLVRVYDGGSPPRFSDSYYTLIIEDRNDNPPVFQNVDTIFVSENVTSGSVVGSVRATDIDVSTTEIIYEIVDSSNSTFTIDENLGSIILKKSKYLDYEKVKFYNLNISASDGLHKTYCQLNIIITDSNDHQPIFTKQLYSVKVQDTIKKGEYITKVSADDLDSGSYGYVQYLLDPPQDAFTIEQDSGKIITNKEFQFNEDATVMELQIVAFDSNMALGYLKSTTIVLLEVEGKKAIYPKFQQSHYYMKISEGASIGAVVGIVTALFTNSIHQHIKYSIRSEMETFSIHADSGLITVNNQLDREMQSSYNIEVYAAIANHQDVSTKCIVSIQVLDINDNNPIFEEHDYNVSVLEDQNAGQILLTVTATDADDSATENGKVRYEIHSGQDENEWLSIDADTGVIRTKRLLDREIRPYLQVTIKAADHKGSGRSDFARLTVEVLDVNDNPPEFKVDVPNYQEIKISENLPANTQVFNAYAFDPDEGSNGMILYSILETDVMFYMNDSTSGLIYTKNSLDYESVSLYNLTVVATDCGQKPLVSSFEYQIHVQDVNEYAPLFTNSKFIFNIPGNLEVGETIGKVDSFDKDGGEANITHYTIISEFSDKFSLDSNSGSITLNKDLRFNNKQGASDVAKYTLKLRADNYPPSNLLYSLTDVFIIVNYTCAGCEIFSEITLKPKQSMTSSSILIVFASVMVLVILIFLVLCIVYCRRKSYRCYKKPFFYNSNKLNLPKSSVECKLLHSYNKHSTLDMVDTRFSSDFPEKSCGTQLSSVIGLLNKSSETSASVTDKASTFSFGIYHEQGAEHRPFFKGVSKLNPKSIDEKNNFRYKASNSSPKNSISIDSQKSNSFQSRQTGSGNGIVRGSHESLKDFMEEGGGEAAGGIDVSNLLYAKLAEVEDQHEDNMDGVKPFKDEGFMSRGGSLSTIIASDEELSPYDYEWPSHNLRQSGVFHEEDRYKGPDPAAISLQANPTETVEYTSQKRNQSSGSLFTLSTTSGNTNNSPDKERIWRSESVSSQLSRITLSDIDLTDDENVRV